MVHISSMVTVFTIPTDHVFCNFLLCKMNVTNMHGLHWHDEVKIYNLESFDSLCELPCGLRRGSGGWG